MKIALFQKNLIWENPTENKKQFDSWFELLDYDTELVVLPEMFTSGFTMNPENIAETIEGETVNWLKAKAKQHNCAITGSMVILENENYYNRMLFVEPNETLHQYNKRHLFTLAGENQKYQYNTNSKTIINYKGWKIALQICYDLRFPVYSRNTENYDLLVYCANWPIPRITAWDCLLKARAIENLAYVVAVNRIGNDTTQMKYNGHSQIINALGDYCIEPYETDEIKYFEINKEELIEVRNRFNFLNDRDNFEITL